MKIGLVIYGSLETISGGYLYDRRLVEALRRAGDRVEIVSLPWRSYGLCLGDNLSRALLDRLAGLDVDVLVQDELNHPSLFWLNRRLRGRVSYPIVAIVHHLRSRELRPAWQNRLYSVVESRYLAGLQGVIANSRTTLETVASTLGRTADRLPYPALVARPAGDRLGPGLTPDEVTARAHEPGPLRLLFVGNLIPRKGLHLLLDALRRVPAGLCELAVAGSPLADPAYARAMARLAGGESLAGQVRFYGALADEQLRAQLCQAQLLVVPSSYEGFGIVYLEGMGFGLPAIATTAGGAGEIIHSGLDGFLVPPGDPAGLAEHLGLLAQDRRRLAALSLAALERFRSYPSWEETTTQIRLFLRSFLK